MDGAIQGINALVWVANTLKSFIYKALPVTPYSHTHSITCTMATEQRTLFLDAAGTPPTLRLGLNSIPKPAADEVLVKIHSAGLNPADAYLAHLGVFIQKYPTILGYDGSGVVEEAGEDVIDFVKGDKVSVPLLIRWFIRSNVADR